MDGVVKLGFSQILCALTNVFLCKPQVNEAGVVSVVCNRIQTTIFHVITEHSLYQTHSGIRINNKGPILLFRLNLSVFIDQNTKFATRYMEFVALLNSTVSYVKYIGCCLL